VYKLAGLCEVEVDATSPQEAMKVALTEAKSINSPAWQAPDNEYLALPFEVGADHRE
jgi:hypothetical protein